MAPKTRVGLGGETVVDPADPTSDTQMAGSLPGRLSGAAFSATVHSAHSAPLVGSAEGAEGEPARGDTIGRFVVLGVLGSGGMGLVYSGYDPHLDRKVAIKLLRGAAVHAQANEARTRLLREAQAMAKISHPNVIKVHEVGTYRDQVYLAMEFADAGTLRDWLKAQPRTRREILDVFTAAGRGLASAHAAGLVHRDFKPDNVMMSKDDGVRVTDFGLVSTLDSAGEAAPTEPNRAPAIVELTASASTPLSQDLTRTGAIMGTPTYMAPEQFAGGTTTARTDQFAFCIALYEALYGERPFAGSEYTALSARVLIGDISPAPKGTKVPTWIRRVLLRGLAVDPAARFPTMTDLLAALARDPARIRRRRVLIGGAITTVLGGVAAVIAVVALRPSTTEVCAGGDARMGAIWNPTRAAAMKAAFDASARPQAASSFGKVTEQLDRWSESWRLGYVAACRDTHVRGEQSTQLLDIRMQCLTRRLDDTRATIDLLAAGGADAIDHAVNAVIALPAVAPCADRAALLADVAAPDDPITAEKVALVRASLSAARGDKRIARYAAGLAIAVPALAAARTTGYAPVIAEALFVVGSLQHELGDLAGIATLDDALHAAAAAGDLALEVDAAAALVLTLTTDTARYDAALEVGLFAEAIAHHAHPPTDAVVRLEDSLGYVQNTRGKPDDARAHYEQALALTAKLGADDPATATTLSQLGSLDKDQGHYADGRARLERVVAMQERVFGKDHPMVAAALKNLGRIALAEGKPAETKQLYERALAIRIAALGPDHPDVGDSYNALGTLADAQGDNAAAKTYYEQALAVQTKAFGSESVQAAGPEMNLGVTDIGLGAYPDAQQHLEHARAIFELAHGPDHPSVANALSDLAIVAQDTHRLDDAVVLLQRVLRISERVYGPDHPDVADALANLASVLKQQKKLDEAEAMTARALRVTEKAYGPTHVRMGMGLTNLGSLQVARGDKTTALATFQKSLAILEGAVGKDHPYVSYPLLRIGDILIDLKRSAEAVPMLERSLAIRVAAKMPSHMIAEPRYMLAQALYADHAQRARAITEAKTALAEYEADKSTDDANLVRAWLKKPN